MRSVHVRILVIEDESSAREILQRELGERGCTIHVAADGEEGLRIGMECELDAAIVDLGLPGIDGLEVLRRWRSSHRTFAVLVLTGRTSWTEKVEALDAGADDYVTKPYHIEELMARLQSIVRRAEMGRALGELRCGPVVLDDRRHRVAVYGREVSLTTAEYRILLCFMLHPGELLSKDQLARWVYSEYGDSERALKAAVLKVHVGQLRRKLDPTDELGLIETVRGQGYRFTLASERKSALA